MNKRIRQEVYNKFNGRCAYTGQPLGDDWQVDHMEPPFYANMYRRDPNRIENLVPALRIVNHYKREKDLESFRKYMLEFHVRLSKYPERPRVEKSIKRKNYMLAIADVFGIGIAYPFIGKFYFETL